MFSSLSDKSVVLVLLDQQRVHEATGRIRRRPRGDQRKICTCMTCSRKSVLRCAIISLICCGSVVLCADAQTAAQPYGDQSWAASSQTITNGANPSRTIESHTKSGNRTFDKKI